MHFIGLVICTLGFLALSRVDSLPMLYVVIVLDIVLGSSLDYNMLISVLIAKVFRERRSLAFRMGGNLPGNKSVLDEMKQLRDLGVYVGTYCQPIVPSLYQPGHRPNGNDSHYQGNRSGPLHHWQRLRPGAAHGRHRRDARFYPGAV